VTDEQLVQTLDSEMNSIAIVVKHMAGNMRSRWTDFLTTDGEKPDRARDTEFIDPPPTREALMNMWEEGWQRVLISASRVGGGSMNSDEHVGGGLATRVQRIATTLRDRPLPHSHH